MAEGGSGGGEEPDESQKTEEPTPKKLQDSKKKGQVAMSKELTSWVVLFAGTMVVLFVMPGIMAEMGQFLRFYIEQPHEVGLYAGGDITAVLEQSYFKTILAIGIPLFLLVVAAIVGPFIQIGPIFAPEVLKPSMDKLSIVKGFKRLFSPKAIVEFLKGTAKLVVITVVAAVICAPYFNGIEHIIDVPVPTAIEEMTTVLAKIMIGILVVMLVVAVGDYAFQKQDHYKKMRMTKQEVKDEFKTTEGSPEVKARLRQLRAEKRGANIASAVPQASVVITNPTHYAVALKYDPDESPAPVCVAKGLNETALRIREIAKEHDIEIQENPPLARALHGSVEVDEMIPMEHFEAVAKIISYIFQKKGGYR